MSFGLIDRCPSPATSLFDRTGDGAVTITDLWRLFVDVFSLPGDLVIALLAQSPDVATFFEVTCLSFGGTASVVASLVFWLWVLTVVAARI